MGQGGAKEVDPYAGMDPIEAYKLSTELANARKVSPEKASKNRKQNLKDALSIVPGIGHAIAAYDAGESGGKAFEAFSEGDLTGGAVNTGMAGLSGLGAVLGLPVGRVARAATKGASSRTNVFVPADTAPDAPRATQTYDELVDDVGMDAANRQAFDETGLFYGPEGALRREIPDNMTFKIQPRAGESHLLGDVIDHPELFKEYPAFKDIPVEFTGSDISTGALTARTNPTTGTFEVAAGQTEPQLRAQFAKLLQYNIDPRSGFANASRETAKHKIDAAQSTIENVRRAMADDLIPAEYGEKYIRSLQGALDESDKIRTGAPGTIGEGTANKARRDLQKGFWSKHSAGNQQVKAVKHRAYHGKDGYPYDPRAASLEDQVSLPAGDIPPESLADFVARWNQYGSGRVKR